jgi:hypothetical protein
MYKYIVSSPLLTISVIFSYMTVAGSVTQKWAVMDEQTIGDDHGLWANGLGASENVKWHNRLNGFATNHFGRNAHTSVWFDDCQDTYAKNTTGGGPVIDEWYDYANIQKGSTVIIDSISY